MPKAARTPIGEPVIHPRGLAFDAVRIAAARLPEKPSLQRRAPACGDGVRYPSESIDLEKEP